MDSIPAAVPLAVSSSGSRYSNSASNRSAWSEYCRQQRDAKANRSLLGGGGVDGCIHEAAGPLLKLECSTLNGCETGQAKITCGYLLPAKCVIHAVGPVARGTPEARDEEELKNCYKNSLKLAVENKLRSVAFPCIATGIYGYPSEDAADVALGTIRNFLEESPEKFDRIIICAFLKKDYDIYLQRFPQYFPVGLLVWIEGFRMESF